MTDRAHAPDCAIATNARHACTCGADPRAPLRHTDVRPRRVVDEERRQEREANAGNEYWRR